MKNTPKATAARYHQLHRRLTEHSPGACVACGFACDWQLLRMGRNRKGVSVMTYEDKISWLRRYQESLRRQRELELEVERLHTDALRVTPLLTAVPGGAGDGQSLSRAVERIVEAQQRLQCQINQCAAVRREVVSVIETISNQRDQEILRRRYILGQRWEAIAVEMKIEYRSVTRRHRKTVEKMVLTL